jgi:magnesium-transporting ATPase (P-type)
MTTKNQINLIKLTYIFLLILGFFYAFGDIRKGFMDGFNGVKPTEELNWLSIVLLFLGFGIGVVILTQLFKFINSVNEAKVFTEKNIKLIQKMGWNCIAESVLLYGFYLSKLKFVDVESMRSVNFEFWLLLFGLTLLTISFVFRKGIQLQREQDLTI